MGLQFGFFFYFLSSNTAKLFYVCRSCLLVLTMETVSHSLPCYIKASLKPETAIAFVNQLQQVSLFSLQQRRFDDSLHIPRIAGTYIRGSSAPELQAEGETNAGNLWQISFTHSVLSIMPVCSQPLVFARTLIF